MVFAQGSDVVKMVLGRDFLVHWGAEEGKGASQPLGASPQS